LPRKRRRGKRYHTGQHNSPKGGIMKYRSNWELQFMLYLDGNEKVVSYSYEAIKIPYVSNKKTGKVRNYLPDFFINWEDGTSEVVEIKPKKKLAGALVQKKVLAGEAWCNANKMTWRIVTEESLKALGIFI
jgi:hypothetical protein